MNPLSLDRFASLAGGRLVRGENRALVSRVCTDSRAMQKGDLFFALKGPRFDAHDYLSQAAQLGAAAAVVERIPAGLPEEFPLIEVSDVLSALQRAAGAYRRELPLKAVCLTGSNGKTSTKDFTHSVLSQAGPATKTEGNLNNHIGLPLTLFRATSEHRFGVFEIGMNHPGEIAPLAALAAPDAAIVTNVGMAHIEHMGSREAIGLEKGMLVEALHPAGVAILNADDDFCEALAARSKANVIRCGFHRGDVRASDERQTVTGVTFRLHVSGRTVEAEIPVPGRHMVSNALLAVGAGVWAGLTPEQCVEGLRSLQLTKGRLQQKTARGVCIVDDTYNANPDSMCAAVETLAALPVAGRRIVVLGRMGELGVEAEPGHRRVGAVAARAAVDVLITVGAEASWIADQARRDGAKQIIECADADAALAVLCEVAREGDTALIKGSRSARMERIVEGFIGA